MSAPAESRVIAGPPRVLWLAAIALAAALALYRFGQWDYWFHLAAGRWIAAHGLPRTEPWCLSALGQWPWLAEWLFHLALYGARALAGEPGVALWRALWAGAAMAVLVWIVRGQAAAGWPALLATPLLFAVTRARLTPRPEQLTLVFALVALALLEHARRGRRDRTAWLVPVQALWANLHPGWLLGPALVWLYALAERAPGAGVPARARARRWLVLGFALVVASALTPRPLDTLTLRVVRNLAANPTRGAVDELRGWSAASDLAGPFTVFLVLAIAAAALGGRRAFRAAPALCAVAVLSLIAGLTAFRLQATAVMLAFPAVAVALGAWRARPALALGALVALAGVAALARDAVYFQPGVSPALAAVPVRAAAVADSLGLDGAVLNTEWYGGYILWARGEAHPPLVDTRNLGSAAFRSRYARADRDTAALDSLLAEWRFTHAILEPPRSSESRMAPALAARADWALVFADDAALLLVRRDRLPPAARPYRLVSPDQAVMADRCARAVADTALARDLVAELERARSESPWHARASLWLGLLALASGRASEAVTRLDEAYRLAPILPGLALRQGLAHAATGDREGARAALRRALAEPADEQAAREALASLR